jgi:hypothetical protein
VGKGGICKQNREGKEKVGFEGGTKWDLKVGKGGKEWDL